MTRVRVFDAIEVATDAIGALSLIACCIFILVEISLRAFFGLSTGVSVEYSGYLFLFLVFFGLSGAQQSGAMIHVGLLFDRIPRGRRYWLDLVRWGIGLIYCCVVTYLLAKYTLRTCELGQMSMFGSQTPLCAPQSVMVFGMSVLAMRFLVNTLLLLLSGRANYEPQADPEKHNVEVGGV